MQNWGCSMTVAEAKVTSNILICEADATAEATLKTFCEDNGLVTMRVTDAKALPTVLESDIDMGGILISAEFGGGEGLKLAELAKKTRPALPVFFRLANQGDVVSLPTHVAALAGSYHLNDLSDLQEMVDKFIFNTWYQERLIRRIQDISLIILNNQFFNTAVVCESPYLIMDNRIYGEVMSLIPIECEWCRGFMLVQGEEESIDQAIQAGNTFIRKTDYGEDFRPVGHILGEISNMVWGAMKNELFTCAPDPTNCAQVPTIISHSHNLISFGTDMPQLCFQYTLYPDDKELPKITIFEKFIFNLSWMPEKFKAVAEPGTELSDEDREVELF